MTYEVNLDDAFSTKAMNIFQKNGFLVVRGVFPIEQIEKILSSIKKLTKDDWRKDYGGNTTFIKKSISANLSLHGVSYAQPITSYISSAQEIYGKELIDISAFLLSTQDVFYKESELHVRHNEYKHQIPSHQDNFYFGLVSPVALTCYIYLTEQNRISGGLGFYPKMMEKTQEHWAGDIEGFSSYHLATEDQSDSFFYPATKPGDVVFHHCNTFHRADENNSKEFTSSISTRIMSRSNLEKDEALQKIYKQNLKKNRGP